MNNSLNSYSHFLISGQPMMMYRLASMLIETREAKMKDNLFLSHTRCNYLPAFNLLISLKTLCCSSNSKKPCKLPTWKSLVISTGKAKNNIVESKRRMYSKCSTPMVEINSKNHFTLFIKQKGPLINQFILSSLSSEKSTINAW